jgi:hypothetical protein
MGIYGEWFYSNFGSYMKYPLWWVINFIILFGIFLETRRCIIGHSMIFFKIFNKFKVDKENAHRYVFAGNYAVLFGSMFSFINLYITFSKKYNLPAPRFGDLDSLFKYIFVLCIIIVICSVYHFIETAYFYIDSESMLKRLNKLSKKTAFQISKSEKYEANSLIKELRYNYFIDRNLYDEYKKNFVDLRNN